MEKLEFDERDGTWHFAIRTKTGCVFYSQDFISADDALVAQQNGNLINQITT